MKLKSILIILVLGAVVGWLAGLIVRGGGFGLIVNIVVGILGAFVGKYIFAQLGVAVGSGLDSNPCFRDRWRGDTGGGNQPAEKAGKLTASCREGAGNHPASRGTGAGSLAPMARNIKSGVISIRIYLIQW